LLSKLELESEIPPELYTLVAEVLAFVYQLDKLAKKRQKVKQKYGGKGKNDA
jgi:type III secretion system FlhB-like substrate exporter